MALKLPTPPTPPTIDKGEASESTPRIDAHQFFEIPFKRESIQDKLKIETPQIETPSEKIPVEKSPPVHEKKITTPEDMAREAVANGAGALVKKTVTRPEAEQNTAPQTNSPAVSIASERQNRGKEILREFQNEDREISQAVENPRPVRINQNESYSGFYWILMLALAGILSFVFVKKFLIRKNPALKKSDLFEDSSERLKNISEKVATPISNTKIPAPKINSAEKISAPIKKSPPKNDDDKGKHFEVRV